jgi:hypothetical protein
MARVGEFFAIVGRKASTPNVRCTRSSNCRLLNRQIAAPVGALTPRRVGDATSGRRGSARSTTRQLPLLLWVHPTICHRVRCFASQFPAAMNGIACNAGPQRDSIPNNAHVDFGRPLRARKSGQRSERTGWTMRVRQVSAAMTKSDTDCLRLSSDSRLVLRRDFELAQILFSPWFADARGLFRRGRPWGEPRWHGRTGDRCLAYDRTHPRSSERRTFLCAILFADSGGTCGATR